jgi:hypothetical protein
MRFYWATLIALWTITLAAIVLAAFTFTQF